MEYSDWPRVPITIPPAPPGLSMEETEQALMAVCQHLWAEERIPVVAWGTSLMAWSFTLLSTTETTLIIVVILQEIATFISDRVAAP